MDRLLQSLQDRPLLFVGGKGGVYGCQEADMSAGGSGKASQSRIRRRTVMAWRAPNKQG